MRIVSWNVNGIRAIYKKGFLEFIERTEPDLLCVQETKARPDQCEPPLLRPVERSAYWSAASRSGYSGVATFAKAAIGDVSYGMGIERYDTEGRFVVSRHHDFTLFNIYFPNGGSGPERHQYKQDFLADLHRHLEERLRRGEQIIVAGDYNVAHREIDIYDPIRLEGESGFMPEERAWFDKFLQLGFVDTFRYFHPDARDRYTWWSYRERGRAGNRGWRIDYICVSRGLVPRLVGADIMDQQEGSDHCPVWLDLKD